MCADEWLVCLIRSYHLMRRVPGKCAFYAQKINDFRWTNEMVQFHHRYAAIETKTIYFFFSIFLFLRSVVPMHLYRSTA